VKTPETIAAARPAIGDRDRQELHYYLTLEPRQLPSRLLYDALGSSLFEAICLLPWYRITRAELQLLATHGAAIGRLAAPTAIIELGCGNGRKLETLIRTLPGPAPDVHLIDVSRDALEQTTRLLRDLGDVHVTSREAAYEEGLTDLPIRSPEQRRLVLFLGSNLGNFDPPAASAFIRLIRRTITAGDWLLMGVDLVKPERDLLLAYDDPLGVTAAFNKNLLLRMNTECGADFDLDGFAHRAHWNHAESRVEMHLVSRRQQRVHVPPVPLDFTLEAGEPIWTESSYKYEPETFRTLVESAGFTHRAQWVDEDARFLLALFEPSAT
jgi:dimethylhistidine N-methyltransferase